VEVEAEGFALLDDLKNRLAEAKNEDDLVSSTEGFMGVGSVGVLAGDGGFVDTLMGDEGWTRGFVVVVVVVIFTGCCFCIELPLLSIEGGFLGTLLAPPNKSSSSSSGLFDFREFGDRLPSFETSMSPNILSAFVRREKSGVLLLESISLRNSGSTFTGELVLVLWLLLVGAKRGSSVLLTSAAFKGSITSISNVLEYLLELYLPSPNK
jgi:hypothetical protein